MEGFLKYYIKNVLKKGWIYLAPLPLIERQLLDWETLIFRGKYSSSIEQFFNSINPYWIFVVIFLFLFAHISIIYNLRKQIQAYALNEDVPDSYKNIIRKIEKIDPKIAEGVKKDFFFGNNCLSKAGSRDVKTAVSILFTAYKPVREIIEKCFNGEIKSFQIDKNVSEIRVKFDDNFNKLEEYNNTIGNTGNLSVGDFEIDQLINKLNCNLNSLLRI
jgi:hypothetical protein